MKQIQRAWQWIKSNGLLLAVLFYTVLFVWSLVLTYKVVSEMLSIAQRGYFISVPTVQDAVRKRLGDALKRRLQPEDE
jgi:hypothetical protein